MPLLLKPQFAGTVIGFNRSSSPLGERTDLFKLYELAKINNNKALLEMFEEIPTEEELDKMKEQNFLAKRNKKI